MASKPIKITVGDTVYTLRFTRRTVTDAESRGFDVRDLDKQPLTKCYEFFYYAFQAEHKGITRDKTDKILDSIGGMNGVPEGFWSRLAELYTEPYNTLQGDTPDPSIKIEL